MHNGDTVQSPNRQSHHQPRFLSKCSDAPDGLVIGILCAQASQAQLQREGPKLVQPGFGLFDDADQAQADKIGVELRRGHVQCFGQIAQLSDLLGFF